MFQKKSCFEFKMFEYKPSCETKFWRIAMLRNQTVPTKALHMFRIQNVSKKVLFRIQNVWVQVFLWNQISEEKSCCKTKLCQEKFKFEKFCWQSEDRCVCVYIYIYCIYISNSKKKKMTPRFRFREVTRLQRNVLEYFPKHSFCVTPRTRGVGTVQPFLSRLE